LGGTETKITVWQQYQYRGRFSLDKIRFFKEHHMRATLLIAFILLISIPLSVQAEGEIVINEIMYNNDGEDVEFIELYNASGTTLNLQNWYLLDDNDDHEPCIIDRILSPGEYVVIVADVNQFAEKYPGVSSVNSNAYDTGGTGWSLGNKGDVVRLFDSLKILHDIVAYDDGGVWPGSPDGSGPSLELLNPYSDNSLPGSWDPSLVTDGTPGEVNSVYTDNIQPTCKNGRRSVALPTSTDDVIVTVRAFDSEGLSHVDMFLNTGQGFVGQAMYDNGLQGDVAAGDSVYTTVIPGQITGTLVKYYAVATDDIGQQDNWPNDAPSAYHAYTIDYVAPRLRITELLAVNNSVNTDEYGEYDDWFEIHNYGYETVDLGGMYISNSLGSSQSFELPQVSLVPDEYVIFWADNEIEQGAYHVDFKLASDGEEIALFETVDHGNVLIHGWKYGLIGSDVSMGFKPEDGTAPEYLASPSPGAHNASSEFYSPVCINEFQSTSDFGGPDDWVEIYNRGVESFDLSGCFLSDQRGDNTKWTFPQGTVLDAGGFLVIYEDALDFGFASEGNDLIMLTAPDSTTGLDFYDFKEQQADTSEGRSPDGVNTWMHFDNPTKGRPNFRTGVEENSTVQPQEFTLHQNYPNPFNPSTTIHFTIPSDEHVTVEIFDIQGRVVDTLVDDTLIAGWHEATWDGSLHASGVYLYRVKAGMEQRTGKMLMVK
jgi:hypothetical protein